MQVSEDVNVSMAQVLCGLSVFTMTDWLIYIWVQDLMVPIYLGLNWQALCAPYQFKGALLLCWSSRWPPDLLS